MSRRSRITTSQQIDRDQRRRVRNAHMWSEAPLPSNPATMPNSGDSGRWDPTWPTDLSWLSPEITWTDSDWTWLA